MRIFLSLEYSLVMRRIAAAPQLDRRINKLAKIKQLFCGAEDVAQRRSFRHGAASASNSYVIRHAQPSLVEVTSHPSLNLVNLVILKAANEEDYRNGEHE